VHSARRASGKLRSDRGGDERYVNVLSASPVFDRRNAETGSDVGLAESICTHVAPRPRAAAHPLLRSAAESAVTVSRQRGMSPGLASALCSARRAMAM
jgi:hypothetical protein